MWFNTLNIKQERTMLKKDVLAYFRDKTLSEIGAIVGRGRSAVSQWKAIIPREHALYLHGYTNGAIPFDDNLYKYLDKLKDLQK